MVVLLLTIHAEGVVLVHLPVEVAHQCLFFSNVIAPFKIIPKNFMLKSSNSYKQTKEIRISSSRIEKSGIKFRFEESLSR